MQIVQELTINNFKSIQELNLKCNRVNVFIGEPNTGKSNILEALNLFSICDIQKITGNIKDIIRYKSIIDLFENNEVEKPIKININNNIFISLSYKQETCTFLISSNEENFGGVFYNSGEIVYYRDLSLNFIKPYYFKLIDYDNYKHPESGFLLTPYASNLYTILSTNNEAYDFANNLISEFGFQLTLEQKTKDIFLLKKSGNRSITIPFNNIADTFLRIIFYSLAIMTNKNSVLIFDEPDVFTFPFYTKNLAEKISRDESNQYFLVTHNPYFLNSLIEKTKLYELNIFVTYFEDNQTKVKSFTPLEIQNMTDLDSSIFFNLKKLTHPEN